MQLQVNSHGHADADIYFLSGYAYNEEINSGLALTGNAEDTLRRFLAPHRINIKDCYRSVVIKEKLKYLGLNAKKLRDAMNNVGYSAYQSIILDELRHVSPTVIVPLDDIALETVYPKIVGVKKPRSRKHWIQCYRGSILPLREDWEAELKLKFIPKVIPAFGHNYLMSNYEAMAYASIDYARIAKWRLLPLDPIPSIGQRWVCKSFSEMQQFLFRAIQMQATKGLCELHFDIETYGGLVTCISLCFVPVSGDFNTHTLEGVSLPITDKKIHVYERALMWRRLAELLYNPALPKVNQNIKYDWTILERHGFVINNVAGDPMLATHLCYAEMPKGLDFLTSIHTDIPYYKDEGKEFEPTIHTRDRLYLYNAQDSIADAQVYANQKKEMVELGVAQLYKNEVVPLIQIYKDIDRAGLLVDTTQRQKLIEKYTSLIDANLRVLRRLIGNLDFNPNSPDQVGKLIYEELRFVSRLKVTDTGKKSYKTDKNTLDDLRIGMGDLKTDFDKIRYHILTRIVTHRKLVKVIEYITTPLHPDGTFRGTSNLAGTETGRSSFSKTIDEVLTSVDRYEELRKKHRKSPWLEKLGRSLQTISKHGFAIDEEVFESWDCTVIANDMRTMFVPRRGYVYIEGDGSQAEARVVAVLAEDYELLESFDKKPKIHAKTAAMLFDVDVNTITKDFPIVPGVGIAFYDLGKRVRHAGNYDVQPGMIAVMTHLPYGLCKNMLTKFHDANPKIRNVFHAEIRQAIKTKRCLVTPYNRRRDFFGRFSEDMYKEGFAQIPQSTISDLTKFTLPRVKEKMPENSFFYVTEQHDGILSEVLVQEKERYLEVFKKCYEREIDFTEGTLSRDFRLVVPAELSVSDTNWAELKEVHV